MSKASEKTLDNNPGLEYRVFGFREDGVNINMSLLSIKQLFSASSFSATNSYTLSENTLSDGSFSSNSLSFTEVTTLTFKNVDNRGVNLLDYFQLLSNNKDNVFLEIKKVGFEVNAYFRISNVTFNTDGTTTFTVALYQTLYRSTFELDAVYTLDFSVEVFQSDYNETDSSSGRFIRNKPTNHPISFITGLQEALNLAETKRTQDNVKIGGANEIDLTDLITVVKTSLIASMNETAAKSNANAVSISNLTTNQITGVVVYQTKALMIAQASPSQTISYKVVNDPTADNNGFYTYNGTTFNKDLDSLIQTILRNNISESTSGKAVYDHLNESFQNLFDRTKTFVSTNGTTGIYNNESSTFSGWGGGVGQRGEFNSVTFKLRDFDPSNVPTQVNVRIRENNYQGTILAQAIVPYSEKDSDNNLTAIFYSNIISSSNLWFEYLADGRVGWYGATIGDVNQNEGQRYTTSMDINGSVSSLVTGGALKCSMVEFNLVENDFELNTAGIAYFKTQLNIDDTLFNLFQEIVNYDSITSEITPTISTGNSRGNPFSGWGSLFNKVGENFNALKIRNVRRTSTAIENEKWQYAKIFVKDSPTSSTIIAESDYIKIDKESTSIEEIFFPLKNPDTEEIITLNDSSFSASTYFIGYIFYNSNKEVAYGGEVLGSQTNYAGSSYYNTTIDHRTWSTYTGNPTIPVEHLLMVNPVKGYSLLELENLKGRVVLLENSQSVIPRIVLPDSYDAVLGYEQQIFFRGIIESLDPINEYNIKVTGNVGGKQYPRYYVFTPETTGTKTFTISLYNKDNILVASDSCSVIVHDIPTNPSTVKKVLCVGDSLTAGGAWTGELQRMLCQTGGTPAGLNLSNIEFIGTVGGGDNKYEGYGGKTWNWYINETTNADVDFTVTSHDKTNDDLTSIWQDSNGNQWRLETVESSTVLVFSRNNHVNNAPSTGTLTHISGASNISIITYNSLGGGSSSVVNKFWNVDTDELDFTNYITDNNFGTIDYVITLLTWNGMSGDRALATDHTTLIDDAKVFIDKLHQQYPNAKVKLLGIQLPSINGGLAQNYGDANSGYGNYFALARTVFGLNLAYQNLANDPAYSSFVEFINVSGQFDTLYNMPKGQRAVNLRNSETETAGTNGVHPSLSGYLQIADAAFKNISKEF